MSCGQKSKNKVVIETIHPAKEMRVLIAGYRFLSGKNYKWRTNKTSDDAVSSKQPREPWGQLPIKNWMNKSEEQCKRHAVVPTDTIVLGTVIFRLRSKGHLGRRDKHTTRNH